jgi:hypothetical protein
MWSTFQTHRLFLRFEELTIYSSKVMVRDDRVAWRVRFEREAML